jgi:hypothetical protein
MSAPAPARALARHAAAFAGLVLTALLLSSCGSPPDSAPAAQSVPATAQAPAAAAPSGPAAAPDMDTGTGSGSDNDTAGGSGGNGQAPAPGQPPVAGAPREQAPARPGGAPPGMPPVLPGPPPQPQPGTGAGTPPTGPGPVHPGGYVRPGGAPKGVEHDIPRVGDDLSDERTWRSSIADACKAVGEPDDCLTLHYAVVAEDSDGGGRHSVRNPGPRYYSAEPRLYSNCDVESVDPSSRPAQTIPSGTRIDVEIVCTLEDPPEPEPEPEPEPDTGTDQAPESGPTSDGGSGG